MSKKKSSKSNIQSQNADTPINFNTNVDDTRPYEQKNMPQGADNKNKGSK